MKEAKTLTLSRKAKKRHFEVVVIKSSTDYTANQYEHCWSVMLLKEKLMIVVGVILAVLGAVYLYIHLPMFGRLPQRERLSRIQKMPNYKDGQFYNFRSTPVLVEKGLGSTWFNFLAHSSLKCNVTGKYEILWGNFRLY